jgi:hypothetical protein
MNEQPVAALAGALFDEAGRLQLADDFLPSHCSQNNLSLGSQQLVRLAGSAAVLRAQPLNCRPF